MCQCNILWSVFIYSLIEKEIIIKQVENECCLFKPQCIDGIKQRSLVGGIEAEENSHKTGKAKRE